MNFDKYKKNEKERIDIELAKYKFSEELKIKNYITDLERQCASDAKDYEHEYHHSMEIKKTELAKLDALIEAKKDILSSKDREIERLNSYVQSLLNKKCCLEPRA